MMRSTLRRPVSLASSYLTFEPSGISMTAWKSRGTSGPGETSCHAWSKGALLGAGFEQTLSQERERRGQGRRSLLNRRLGLARGPDPELDKGSVGRTE